MSEQRERIYTTTVFYDNDGEFDLFVTLEDCQVLIDKIYCKHWVFEDYNTREEIMAELMNSDTDERYIKFLEFLDDDAFWSFGSDSAYEQCYRVLEDCGQIIPAMPTRSVYY